MYALAAALISALPAFFFAWVALRQRGDETYEDRLEREIDELRAENEQLKRWLSDARDENIRLMKKLLANGETK